MLNPFSPPQTIKDAQTRRSNGWSTISSTKIRPLTQAVKAVYRRSRDWSTPAARQIHLDVTRFRSRLITSEAQRTELSS
jgi:hypothetical protein